MPGAIVLYLFCLVRMLVPVEFSWTRVIAAPALYNKIYDALTYKIDMGVELYIWQMLALVWLFWSLLLLLRLAGQYIRAARYFGRLKPAENEMARNVAGQITGGKRLELVQTPTVRIPCCLGAFRKRVLIPDKPFSEKEMYYIILHEYTHLQNNDFLTKMLVNVLCAVYWWNPFVYLLKNDLNQSMEIRCDYVVTQGMDRQEKGDYLAVMLKVFKSSREIVDDTGLKGVTAKILGDCSERLMERFRLVVDDKRHLVKRGKIYSWMIAAGLLVLSYSFEIQTKYDAPRAAIEIDQNTYEVTSGSSCIYKKKNGSYVFHSHNEDIPIAEDSVKMLVQDGFKMIEGE